MTTSTPPPTPTPSSIQESTSTTTIARASATKAETIDPQVLELVTEIATLPAAQIQNKVDDIISSGINNAEAELLATSPAILENINKETATAIFEAITESNLTADQGQQIVNAVQNAPTTIRKAFEKSINVFGGATDTYVPIGSRVPISARRIIIITTGLLVALPSPIRKKP
jgi:actin-related protein